VFDEDAPQQELDLGVEAAKVASGPALQRVQDVGIDSQEEWFSVSHGTPSYRGLKGCTLAGEPPVAPSK
jgi:hypothetical protein